MIFIFGCFVGIVFGLIIVYGVILEVMMVEVYILFIWIIILMVICYFIGLFVSWVLVERAVRFDFIIVFRYE